MEQRAVIKFNAKLGRSASETYILMKQVYGTLCLSKSNVFIWHKRFSDGRNTLEDDKHTGRPSSSKTPESIEKVREFVENNDGRDIKIIHYVIEGWPISKKDIDEDVKPYYDFRHRIYLWNELLCVGSAIVVPGTQRNYMLEFLHQSHQGISAIQGLARESLFWPGMSMDIAERVKNCEICQKYQKSREMLGSFPIPDYPWQTVSMDIFYIERKPHLLIVDRFSGYPEVYAL
ncbi:K02A2.6-like [Cordylochernes scorpioides]|uniref:RNA-directed DNA polymerase n=1 Tax=Cordylochernes scorpioides TaxID=51811 RepID=A0ABY6LPD9_9ARAC|nr:K02A2.6-like [Cordylochernes scorpioides]